jgi:hypothetical protein
MAELADALDSGSSEQQLMQVQVLFLAPARKPRSKFAHSLLWVRFAFSRNSYKAAPFIIAMLIDFILFVWENKGKDLL